jgi:16S rRNA (guanine527-N7)-methyltransferase
VIGFAEALARRAGALRVTVPPDIVSPLERYFDLLARWNHIVNLTAFDVEALSDEAIDRLLVEPLAAVRFFDPGVTHWVDLGTGGGSPAIPLKLSRPAATLRMVESRGRKVAFLREVVRGLGVTAATVEPSRFEQLVGRPEWTGSAEIVTARAVRHDSLFVALVEQLLRPGGALLAFDSQNAEPIESDRLELAAAPLLLQGQASRLSIYKTKG